MINLMDGGRRRRRPSKREQLEMAGFTVLSVTGAVILLPVIGLKAVMSALPFVRTPAIGDQQGHDEHYLIN
ncbi:hypothetical protein Asphe3_30550 [Pseudarthrobacter phenanthrenivorans Sphe3]|uniref:Uncharacterized protein n=1 Tax=Pseudarthrobacter phenanthrenivorans (strain DSM 18606 / JCM 16027 / LMG 23796 / Sphe3) TaxID=930171 RepID=F0M1G9_PSEPM|nr:hypothetical protein [Pseudarthrobacter phenanthrenivorans]ADX74165.1 hypothetical protein Asphe3_30550 [Pseudarthrobacter phenanthrenivorans Sphe3]